MTGEELKQGINKVLKATGKLLVYAIIFVAGVLLALAPLLVCAGCDKASDTDNGISAGTNNVPTGEITNPTTNGEKITPSTPGSEITTPTESDKPGQEIPQTEKTEEELIAEGWEFIGQYFENTLGFEYSKEDEALYFYVKDEENGEVSLNWISAKENLETSKGMQEFIEKLSTEVVGEFVNFAESDRVIKFGGRSYSDPIKGQTAFTDLLGVETTQVVSKFGELEKDGKTYSMTYYAVTSEKTYYGNFSATIDKENPTEEEIYEALMMHCDEVKEIDIGVNITEIKGAQEPQIIESPEVTTLDFSGLEQKLEEVITSQSKYNKVNEIVGYGISNGKLNVVYDFDGKYNSFIQLYETDVDSDLDSQEEINNYVDNFDETLFTGVASITKASSDITVNGTTYSKDGIDGDNIFAAQCGVTSGAVKTYVSDMKSRTFGDYPSGYCRGFDVLVVGDSEVGIYHGTVDYDCATDNHWDNIIINGKHSISLTESINIGKNLKTEEVQSSAVAIEK